ncbi:MAG TPA: lipopolysaccharide biosynthesis protein [Candidatus Dormibacteraeota bacterium]|nr:lipopolysaccharide biosynthesis protein [Candidatus Dormibacteraeota bacterium]
MRQRQLFLNALTTSIQVIASAAILFLLYRFLIRAIGMERLGIWSVVLATTSIVALAHQGFSTSIIKFVAKYAARENFGEVSTLIQTVVLSIGPAVALIAAGFYPLARWVLALVVPRAHFAEACAILPFALVCLWCNIMQGILQAGLAGQQWITLCNYLELGGSLSYLLLAFALVPAHGLEGLAVAQALQAAVFVALSWILLRRKLPQLPLIPHRWNRNLFREIAAYGLHFQLITASQSLREPVAKALIAKFGGLAMTGLYDLASRWVVTFRELIVQANQVLVPTVSNLQERDAQSLPALYRESYRMVFFLAVPTFAGLVLLAPLVSRVWIGRYEPMFVEFVCILAVAWLVNILSNSAYVIDLGTGALRWVTIGCISTAALNAGLGYLVGHYFGGVAVVAASAFSLAFGYVLILVAYHLANHVPFVLLLPDESRELLTSSAICAAICLPLSIFLRAHASGWVQVAVAAVLLALLLIPVWRHPLRKRLLQWAFSRTPSTIRAEAS